ncbi:hypothetical protein PtA15_2A489 [Puccinia triticina]|uniref:NEDD8-activating enzyme E1 regulatory subunit n=1 Tax=Puccinia triticina TaxID=208348 RepID=A0ABY7CAX9_9BASI|nr:uncharacterized protein PtA15_2A489 [Puccinia triticina]WAQ82174.1 hypothetical protein PtA15_2A489 [Puccinia triticina]WAR53030.1 hypothetical protein PtB15_2B458 [Puccinia triticina]
MRLDMYDDQVVRQSDIGHHLFLDQGSLGKNRSEECCRMLKEVARSKGRDSPWIDGNDFLLDRDHYEGIDEFEGFWGWSAFICVRLNSEAEQVTSRYCWDFYVPAIFVQTCGLVARIRLQIREHSVIQIHPNSLMDLRLDCPFPSLSEFVKSFEMDKIDSGERANVPAVVIVIHFLELFKSKHCGIPPLNSAGKAELKEMILAEKQNDNEKNFDEAVDLIEKACQPTKVPRHIEELFNDPQCDKIPWFNGKFWVLVRSLREFVKTSPTHQLPLSGALPEMKTDTKNNIKMRSIYYQQALEDLERFKEIVDEMTESVEEEYEGRPQEYTEDFKHWLVPPELDISPEMVKSFAENSAHIRVVRGSRLGQDPKDLIPQFVKECQPGNEEYHATWYVAFEAMAAYRSKREGKYCYLAGHEGEYPGMRKDQEDGDLHALWKFSLGWLNSRRWAAPRDDQEQEIIPQKLQKVLKEMIRLAGSELPHIGSMTGGLVSQEVIKLITGQYIPTNGVCIYDGYQSMTRVLEF